MPPETRKNGSKGPRILIVDDDPGQRSLLDSFLRSQGFDTVPVASGELALETLRAGGISMMISDVRMPGLDGVALLRRIKARFPAIPVVLVSAFPDEQVWAEGLEAGAADVFPKPIHGASLVRALRETVNGSQAHGFPAGENPDPRGPGVTTRKRDK